MFELVIDKRKIGVRRREKITAGSVGIRTSFEFSQEWNGLGKTAVFETDKHKIAVALNECTVTVPWEVCEEAGLDVIIGVYGTNADGSIVIPTVWAKLDTVSPGADTQSADNSQAPTATELQQILSASAAAVDAARAASVSARSAAECAADVKARADNGEFNGRDGIDGINGRDYDHSAEFTRLSEEMTAYAESVNTDRAAITGSVTQAKQHADDALNAKTDAQSAKAAAETAAIAARAAADSVPAIVEEVRTEQTRLSESITENATDLSDFSTGGKLHIVNNWVHGSVYSGAFNSVEYRVRMSTFVSFDKDVTLSIKDGFKFWICIGNLSNVQGAKTTDFTVPKNTDFLVFIARVTENTSEVADIGEFRSALYFEQDLFATTESVKSMYTSAQSSFADFSEKGILHIDNDWVRGSVLNGKFNQITYRVRMSTFVSYETDLTLFVKTGFRFWLHIGDLANLKGPFESSFVVPKNTEFVVVIARTVDDASEIADIEEFKKAVYFEQSYYHTNYDAQLTQDEIKRITDRVAILEVGYSNFGKYGIGALDQNTGELQPNAKYRVSSTEVQYAEDDITAYIYDDKYSFGIQIYDYDGKVTTNLGFYITPQVIKKGTFFKITVRANPQDTSLVLDDESAKKMWNAIGIKNENYNKIIGRDIVSLNMDREIVVANFSKSRSNNFTNPFKPLEFVHFTDVHAQPTIWKNICDYMDVYSKYLPFALHTGDFVTSNQTQYVDLYTVQKPITGYILNCVGNHDTYVDSSNRVGTAKSVYDLLFNHTDDWGVTFGAEQYAMYYYKDFADSGIRLIVLDQFYWTTEQKNWLENTLNSAKSLGYAVITAAHVFTSHVSLENRVDVGGFNTFDAWTTSGELTQNVVPEIDSVLSSYITGGGLHICHLSGHYHHDIFGYSDGGILNICAESATFAHAEWDDTIRVERTRSYDAFNVFSADRTTGTIRIARIGNNADYYGRAKNVLCYDYVNKKVIANY